MTPAIIETSLRVLVAFTDAGGFEWKAGDVAPLHQRTVRRAALEHPEWFACEFETVDVDPDWLREIDTKYEAELDALKRRREERRAREERALREEYEAQDSPDKPDSEERRLERAYERQEREREQQQQRLAEERERQGLERELAFGRGGVQFDR
jgi:hypothetical protein